MNKSYVRINWQNEPSTSTPINETNLNKMDYAVNEIDNRVIELDTTKVSSADIQNYIKNWSMDTTSGLITVTYVNNTTQTFDLNIEKIPVSFTLSADGVLTMTTADGTEFTANIKDLIPDITFTDSDTISSTKNGDNYTFNVVDGSITEDKLQTDFLADIRVETATSTTNAQTATSKATEAKSYAVGGTGTRSGEDTDNAKYYAEQAKAAAGGDYVARTEIGVSVASLENGKVPTSQLPTITSSYSDLSNKPSINGVELSGNKTTSDLGISYNDLANKPTIPSQYELPTASTDVLGGIKVGDNLSIDSDGKLSASASVVVDSALSLTSENPVQNKVITENIKDIRKNTIVNLLNPTLVSAIVSGITVTNNGNGTYTLNGTATDAMWLSLGVQSVTQGVTYKYLGLPNAISKVALVGDGLSYESESITFTASGSTQPLTLYISSGAVLDNVLFKPMLTTMLTATYDDFVPYESNSSDWELIGSVTGANNINVDSTAYKEFLVERFTSTNNYLLSRVISAKQLTKNFVISDGFYVNSNTYVGCWTNYVLNSKMFHANDFYVGSTNVVSTSVMTVYGRK